MAEEQPLAVSVAEAARLLDLSERTVREMVANERIKVVRVGSRVLIPRASLTALLDERAVEV